MNINKTLEFDKIIEMLCEFAFTDVAKQKLSDLKPYLNERDVISKTKETTEARMIYDSVGNPPLTAMKDINKILEISEKGGMLIPEQLSNVVQFISSSRRIKAYLKKAEILNIEIAYYGQSIDGLDFLYEEIDRCIRNNIVDNYASKELREIRRKIENVNGQIKAKLEHILRSKKEYFSDGFVSTRNGHFVLPVKKEYKHQVQGSVIDTSSTGSTYFIEPLAVSKLQDELALLKIAESNEENKILYTLSSFVDDCSAEIKLNIDAMETLDFIFAKAKLSSHMKAIPANINTNRVIKIEDGRHPLLNQAECVPLNFSIGDGINGVVITGPNTGGKTVALKTVGLISLMAQSGLHVPCKNAEICMNNAILCDIGDGQSITENLSTFSSHIKNIIKILTQTSEQSLVLLDELGSGTDPAEGMGIAIAILEELRQKQCLFVATTHYPEVKEYAKNADQLINAKMAFDKESFKPLYKLEIGEAGESCALYIAKRLGMPKRMLEIAYNEAYCKNKLTQQNDIDTSFIEEAKEMQQAEKLVSIQKQENKPNNNGRAASFNIGDSVFVYPNKQIGIVCQKANSKGEVGVQIQKEKQLINHKRLKLNVAATELYPDDYDFSIIFDTVANRKARHQMGKRHRPDLQVTIEDKLI